MQPHTLTHSIFLAEWKGEKVGLTLNSTEACDSYQKQNMGVAPG